MFVLPFGLKGFSILKILPFCLDQQLILRTTLCMKIRNMNTYFPFVLELELYMLVCEAFVK